MNIDDPTAWPMLDLAGVHTLPWPGHEPPVVRVASIRAPLAVRLARNVVKRPDGCWFWTGPHDRAGYGRMKICGRDTRLSRAIWEIANGAPLLAHEVARHTCDNPPCLNPDHLRRGTVADNNRDRDVRGRTARGERHYAAKLTESDVHEIRRRASRGEQLAGLACAFGVSSQLISRIVLRQVWARLQDDVA